MNNEWVFQKRWAILWCMISVGGFITGWYTGHQIFLRCTCN